LTVMHFDPSQPVFKCFYVALSYFVGSCPTGYLMGRCVKGVDIRTAGSGNVGATNVFRTVGVGPGVATLLIDMLKGLVPVWVSLHLFPGDALPILTGLASVAGHTWSPFLRLKGGKGVATSAGVFAALLPIPTLASVLSFVLGFGLSRRVSVGSLLGAMVLPSVAFAAGPSPRAWLALLLGLLVILKHIPNIRRLLKGEEPPLIKKKESQTTP
jgi:acyl phosphate:glycerol-3-phosphate acyltransferase